MNNVAVMIVETDSTSAAELEESLQNLGYGVCAKEYSLLDALNDLAVANPDLVLLNPAIGNNSQDGIQPGEFQERSGVPVIYLEEQEDNLKRQLLPGQNVFACLLKPCRENELHSMIQVALYKHRAEKALCQSEQKYRLLFESMFNGFVLYEVVYDNNGNPDDFRVLDINPALEDLLGVNRDEMLGRSMQEIFSNENDICRQYYREAVDTGRSVSFEFYNSYLNNYLRMLAFSFDGPDHLAVILEAAPLGRSIINSIHHSYYYDSLTGIPNRDLCLKTIENALHKQETNKEFLFAVLFLDLDRFKLVNESLGYSMGDILLQKVASRLQKLVRSSDTVSRVGDDEFAIILEELGNEDDVMWVVDRINMDFERAFAIGENNIVTSLNMGICSGSVEQNTSEQMLEKANIAMHQAKQESNVNYKFYFENMRHQVIHKLSMETSLRNALKKNEFLLFFQSIVTIPDAELLGFEALIRWNKGGEKIISPAEFIPVAEETGLIIPIGEWVMYEACRTMASWQKMYPREKPWIISVNLSASQFAEPGLVEKLENIVKETGLPPESLRIEITESVVMKEPECVFRKLRKLKDLGIAISVDDFGTGYSSLSYLQRFPLDSLKVDRSFVSFMDRFENRIIVNSVINLAHNLELDVVAEGIETEEQMKMLHNMQCKKGQGFYFSKPVPGTQAEKLIQDNLP